jgi:hypothetical protein
VSGIARKNDHSGFEEAARFVVVMSGKEKTVNAFPVIRASQVAHQLSTTLVTKFDTNTGVRLTPPSHGANGRFSMWNLQETDTGKSVSTQFTRRLVLMNGPDYDSSARGRFERDLSAPPEDPSKQKNCLQIEVTKADFEFWTSWRLFCARRIAAEEAVARRHHISLLELQSFVERGTASPADQPGAASFLINCPLKLMQWRDGRGPRYALRFRYYRNQVSDEFLELRRGDRVDLKLMLSGLYMISGHFVTAFKFTTMQRHIEPLAADRIPAPWTYEDAIREFPPREVVFVPRPAAAPAAPPSRPAYRDPFPFYEAIAAAIAAASVIKKPVAAAVPMRNVVAKDSTVTGTDFLKPDVSQAECCVCMDAAAEVVVHPCRHVNYCLRCVDNCIKAKNVECAFCRKVISSYTMLVDTPASAKDTLFFA